MNNGNTTLEITNQPTFLEVASGSGGGGGGGAGAGPALPHYFWVGPASGTSIGTVSFRAAVSGDVPFAAILSLPNVYSDVNTFPGIRLGKKTVTTNYTVVPQDFEILVNASSANIIITAPFATGSGHLFRVKRIDESVNSVVVQARSGDLIDGSDSIALVAQYDGVSLFDGAVGYWDQSSSIPVGANVALLNSPNVFTQVNQFHGVRFTPVSTITNYTAQPTDFGVNADATNDSLTISLPPSTGQGQLLHVKKLDGSPNIVTIDPNGSDTIDGSISINLIDQWADCLLYDAMPGYWDNIGASGAGAGGFELPVVLPGMRIKADGSFQLWNPDQSKYFTILIRGAAGQEYIDLVRPGET